MGSSNKAHILIAGAGIGGLTLAQCLRKQNHPFTIFDRDDAVHSRPQGWAISLHTVLSDMVSSVPDDMPSIEMVNHLLPLSELPAQLSFFDIRDHGKPARKFMVESKSLEEVGYGPGRIIRANRDRLRDWLTTNIDVQWGKKISTFKQDDSGVTVHFADGTTVQGDILVGADGVRSAVRATLLPEAQLQQVPECFVTGEVTLSKADYEKQLQLSHSAYAVAGDGFHIFVGLNKVANDASSADWYWDLIWADEARAASSPHWIDTASAEELYAYAVEKTKDVDPTFTEIIRLTKPQQVTTPPLILRDLVLNEMPVSRVTLLGDAAHAMVPFKGEGGCHAVDDAIKLSKVLVNGGSLDEYQKEMLERGSSATKASRAAGNAVSKDQTAARRAWGQEVRPAPLKT